MMSEGVQPEEKSIQSHQVPPLPGKKKKKKENPHKSQTTVDSKTHPHFWESYCSEFGAWYVMLVGMLKLSSEVNFSSNTMRIHGFCVRRPTVPKIEAGGGGSGGEAGGGMVSYLKLHSHDQGSRAGILCQPGCS